MSVRADAASMASRPTLFLSRYGVASRPCKYRDVTKIFTEIFFWILEIINPGQFVSIKLKDTEMHIKCVNKSFSLLDGTLDCSASVLQVIKTDQKYFKYLLISGCHANIYKYASYPGNDDACNGDFNAGSLQQLVSEIHPVPERDDISLDGYVVFSVKPATSIYSSTSI